MTNPARRPAKDGQSTMPFANLPLYELRRKARRGGSGEYALEIWQLPSPATPRLDAPEYVATLHGAALRLIETRISRRLARGQINLASAAAEADRRWPLEEDLALSLGLLFRALAPMRNLDRIRQVADGIEAMSREEAGYWLGMALDRKHPRPGAPGARGTGQLVPRKGLFYTDQRRAHVRSTGVRSEPSHTSPGLDGGLTKAGRA